MLAHKGIFISSLVISFIGLIFQVLIPKEVALALDEGLKPGGAPLTQFVAVLVVLALLRFAANYSSRLLLLRTAYRIEYDLRNILYEHFTRMTFSFYDRVQSGQLISRANSDIRSVEMFLAFAPTVAVQMVTFLIALVLMLRINVGLTLITLVPLPLVWYFGTLSQVSGLYGAPPCHRSRNSAAANWGKPVSSL